MGNSKSSVCFPVLNIPMKKIPFLFFYFYFSAFSTQRAVESNSESTDSFLVFFGFLAFFCREAKFWEGKRREIRKATAEDIATEEEISSGYPVLPLILCIVHGLFSPLKMVGQHGLVIHIYLSMSVVLFLLVNNDIIWNNVLIHATKINPHCEVCPYPLAT